jgi:hypothetical protein
MYMIPEIMYLDVRGPVPPTSLGDSGDIRGQARPGIETAVSPHHCHLGVTLEVASA